jgi:RNA polymerase sigma-70 factor (ECF subfamily)
MDVRRDGCSGSTNPPCGSDNVRRAASRFTVQSLNSSASLQRAAEDKALESTVDLERFLAGVEQRAFRMARYAVRDTDDALDIVQDAMIRLAKGYANRPVTEWSALFYRILQNRIRDHQRRKTVRNRVMSWMGHGPAASGADELPDPVETAPDPALDADPAHRLMLADAGEALERAIAALPRRQQEAFLLRAWEGLDVAETAKAMGCSQGSVKTHYSRAVHALRTQLGEHRE